MIKTYVFLHKAPRRDFFWVPGVPGPPGTWVVHLPSPPPIQNQRSHNTLGPPLGEQRIAQQNAASSAAQAVCVGHTLDRGAAPHGSGAHSVGPGVPECVALRGGGGAGRAAKHQMHRRTATQAQARDGSSPQGEGRRGNDRTPEGERTA